MTLQEDLEERIELHNKLQNQFNILQTQIQQNIGVINYLKEKTED